ncbi:MAG: hypothetical protein C0169_05025 [Thermodesulfobacterium geofontis]|uniref:Uncharacterized protein n=1 Tax=Thermodesulfobacterium geofontis TaxID=1295609 RepID=A0A2N7QBP8_9BACT|nr:MAG: hypothetical protein C0169_05025 [Thermodesulfobacterium geofontis]
MLEFSKRVRVIPWNEEFSIADKNPEKIEKLSELEKLFLEKKLSKEEYLKKVEEIEKEFPGYASRTEGVAFIEDNTVAFRDENPDIYAVLHELGHVYFGKEDPIWSADYGGAEILFMLALNEKYDNVYEITEENIWKCIEFLEKAETSPEELEKEISEKIIKKLGISCYPSIYALSSLAGAILEEVTQYIRKEINFPFHDVQSEAWGKIPVTKSGVRSFFSELLEGLKWKDPFWMRYAEALELCKII